MLVVSKSPISRIVVVEASSSASGLQPVPENAGAGAGACWSGLDPELVIVDVDSGTATSLLLALRD